MATASVMVTGLGLVTPFGIGCDVAWKNIQIGASATREVRLPVGSLVGESEMAVAGGPAPELNGADSSLSGSPGFATSLLNQLIVTAAREAVQDAGSRFASIPRNRVGCVIGTSKPALRSVAGHHDTLFGTIWPSSPASAIAVEFDIRGPCLTPVAACATGLLSIIRGAELIQSGICDAVIAGSVDASLLPIVVGSYRRLGILSRDSADRAVACRPFDRDRDGFVIGEGAGVVVLERVTEQRTSQQQVYAEFLSGSLFTDPCSLTQPSRESEPIERLIRQVLTTAGIAADEIDYINLHGSATRANDRVESAAVRRVFRHSPKSSSLKGGIGHLLGAAGSVELILSLLAMRDRQLPPSINLSNVDPECELNFVGATAEPSPIHNLLKLSLGFGGHLAGAVFRNVLPRQV